MLTKYSGFKFYVQNMAGYYGAFIYKALDKYIIDNKQEQYNNYHLDPKLRDNNIIMKIEIKKRKK